MKERAKNIDKKMFDCIKILLNGGASYQEIQEYTNVGKTTVARIKNCEDWEDYQQQMAAMRVAWHASYREKQLAREKEEAEKKAKEQKEAAAKAAAEAVKAVPASQLVPPTVQASPAPTQQMITVPYRVYELLTKQNELLTGISNKLAYIVEELAGVPSPNKDGENA